MARTRPRLYAFPREVELDHVREVARSPEELAALEGVIDAFGRTARRKRLDEDDLDALLRAARHANPSVRGIAVTRLAVLTHYFEPARDALRALQDDEDAGVREFGVTATANAPPEVTLDVVTAALDDPEWAVRKAAARVAGAVPLPRGEVLLTGPLAAERDARVRVALELALRFQRTV